MPTPSDHRVNIILPPTEAELADRIADAIGAGDRGRSAAIRYALRQTARALGVEIPVENRAVTKGRKKV